MQLLRGTTPELARRWLAALLIVPPHEREALVDSMEQRVLQTYGDASELSEATSEHATSERATLNVVYPPLQRDGYVEQQIVEYAAAQRKPVRKSKRKAQ